MSKDLSGRNRYIAKMASEECNQAVAYKIAVTTKHGTWVDTHYGHAERFHVFETDGVISRLLNIRECQKYCLGEVDCDECAGKRRSAIESIADCDAVLTMRIGPEARRHLQDAGVATVEICINVEEGLLYAVRQLSQEAEELGGQLAPTVKSYEKGWEE